MTEGVLEAARYNTAIMDHLQSGKLFVSRVTYCDDAGVVKSHRYSASSPWYMFCKVSSRRILYV